MIAELIWEIDQEGDDLLRIRLRRSLPEKRQSLPSRANAPRWQGPWCPVSDGGRRRRGQAPPCENLQDRLRLPLVLTFGQPSGLLLGTDLADVPWKAGAVL